MANFTNYIGSVVAMAGGTSQSVAISGTSAQSSAISSNSAVVSPTVDCFFRQGSNPTALADGTDQFLAGGGQYRITEITSGNKLAFITTGAVGAVYVTQGA